MSRAINVGSREICDGKPVFIIAEIGINHGGDVATAMELLRQAKKAGADAAKLQTYVTEKRVPADSPVFDILKACELSFEEQRMLFRVGRELGIIVFSTPFDEEAVDFLESIDAPVYKIASFDSVNKVLLRKVGATGKPVIMSTGMTTREELSEARMALGGGTNSNDCHLALLHCVSAYPLGAQDANLSVIASLKELHDGPVGYSDHTIGIDVPSLAISAGASIIEKHFTLDSTAEGPDHALSADPEMMTAMVRRVRQVEAIMGSAEMRIREAERGTVPFRRPSV